VNSVLDDIEKPRAAENTERSDYNHQLAYGLIGSGLVLVILGLVSLSLKSNHHRRELIVSLTF